MNASEPLLSVRDLRVSYDVPNRVLPWKNNALSPVIERLSFDLNAGETLGVVGESGSGKSTLARAILRMLPVQAGQVIWRGQDILTLSNRKMRAQRKQMQMIFQDPLASLNPRMTIGDIVAEPLQVHYPELSREKIRSRVGEMLERVGILPTLHRGFPHEFSGGQCQRIGIARALILKPKLIVCDEPVSALDVSIQAQVINLLKQIQRDMALSLIFIAHDLSIVKHISDRVMVLYRGNIVEMNEATQLYRAPVHPYTKALVAAIPSADLPAKKLEAGHETYIPSRAPNLELGGCIYRDRCLHVSEKCQLARPTLTPRQKAHSLACHNF